MFVAPKKPEDKRIADFVAYDPETGAFTWRQNCGQRGRIGNPAGSIWSRNGQTRYVIRFGRRGYQGNRVAWLIMTGDWPASLVDHEDGDSLNNRWRNLRLATKAQNCANAKRRADNGSGFKGVNLHSDGRSYVARIQHNGRRLHLGCFPTAEDAYRAYCLAAEQYHQQFRRVS